MKTKYFHLLSVVLLVCTLLAGLFVGDASKVRAQSSRVWSDPINLSNSGAASNPVFVVDALGLMHGFWVDQFEGYKYVQSADGKEWTLPVKGKFPFNSKGPIPVVLAGPNGFIYVFWQTIEKGLVFAQAHSETLADSSGWGYKFQLSNDVLAYDVAIDPQGVLHLAYIRNKNSDLGPAGVYYARSSDEGRSWSVEKLLYESQYFRTTKPETSHIRVAASSDAGGQKVYVAWDNTGLKRIFMSASTDSGLNWTDVVQLKGPEDTGGYDMPFNVNMSVTGEKAFLTWEVGEPNAMQCTLYGQWSTDGGGTWSDPDVILDSRSICPLGVDILVQKDDSLIALLSYQGNPSLLAWNGVEWSDVQAQDELSYFSNPVTNETILLGCQFSFVKDSQLFLGGCDQGSGGDIWVTSRPIVPINDWAFSGSYWSLPTLQTTSTQKISFLTYTADGNYLHALWSQSPLSSTSVLKEAIYYSRWDRSSQWSAPHDVLYGLNGTAGELSVAVNGQGRLLLVWSDEDNGDLLFSWANSSKANSSAEWESPHDLPAPSHWTSSPEILVDASDRIVVVYAVPFNEKRGIYIVQSVDNGTTWSTPVSVFDAESAGWIMVNHPKVALSGDGKLHVLFTSYSGLNGQSDGLYYVQSSDGGFSWSPPDIVSESSIVWSDIVGTDENTVHRIWQENDDSVIANIHQVSNDGGSSWGKEVNITGVSDAVTPVALVSNGTGELHLIQLVEEDAPQYIKEYNLSIKDWRWDGSQWTDQPSQKLNIKGDKARFSVAAGISVDGFVSVSILAEYHDLNSELKNEVYNIGRLLSGFEVNKTPYPAIISAPNVEPVLTQSVNIQPTLSATTQYPDITDNAPSALSKNLVGIFLVLFLLGLTGFIFLRRVKKSE